MTKLEVSEFELPDFLQADEDEIHERMLESSPRNYDVSEGTFFFDATKPVAIEKARMISFNLSFALQMMFPQFAEGVFLDYHGESFKLPRHPAVRSNGFVIFGGDEGTLIPAGTVAMTPGTDDTPPIRFVTLHDVEIDETERVEVAIRAVEPGRIGNVPADSITLLEESITGITFINNETATINGDDEESDDHYRERILERRQKQSLSGAVRDYIAWAKEVEGVGEVIVLPEWNGAGTVKVLITARSGGIASNELINDVQEHIAPDGRDGGGLAPIGALVTIDTVEQLEINVSFDLIVFKNGVDQLEVIESMKAHLFNYFNNVSIGGTIVYNWIGTIVMQTKGIKDYEGLEVNDGTENIQLNEEQIAVIGEVTYGEG